VVLDPEVLAERVAVDRSVVGVFERRAALGLVPDEEVRPASRLRRRDRPIALREPVASGRQLRLQPVALLTERR